MALEPGKQHENTIKGSMSLAFALVGIVEIVEVITEEVVEVVGVGRVLGKIGGPGEEGSNCVTVLAKC